MAGDGWYSLAGYLHTKVLGGAFTYLKPRRRYYFVLDEVECRLAYFKDETEFIRKKEAVGHIDLRHSGVTLSESNARSFVIHATGGRKFELEAENEQSTNIWLTALQNRKDDGRKRSLIGLHTGDSDESDSVESSPDAIRSRRFSSSSLPSDAEMASVLDTAFQLASIPKINGYAKTSDAALLAVDSANKLHHYATINSPRAKDDFQNQRKLYFKPASEVSANTQDDSDNTSQCSTPRKQSEAEEADLAETKQSRYFQNELRNWLNKHHAQGNGSVDTHSEADLSNSNYMSPELMSMSKSSYSQQSSHVGERAENELNMSEEIQRLKEKEHNYQQELQRLNQKNQQLTAELAQHKQLSQSNQVQDKNYLLTQNRFLNSEVVRLSAKWQDDQSQYVQLNRRVVELETQLDQFKQQYVFLLQSCIRIPVCERHSVELVEVKLFGGDVHKKRVCQLLDEARRIDPTLPTFESLTSGNAHVDLYGFRHSFAEESLALHYICTQLHQHYQSQLTSQQQHRHRWKLYLAQSKNIFVNNKETRALVRSGIPSAYRSIVWRCLIHQQVVGYKVKFGKYYYRNLCSSQGSADVEFSTVHQKQIMLDLLRTMPNNVHFSAPTCKGVNQLQTVLRAYCLHNSTIGYCQGMNFIAGTCLLFLSPEDTFWFLVSLTEKYFVSSYFDNSLTGAQADQEVLKDMVAHMLPGLAEHLEKCDIDLATVTLNWFLALFFDAVPFQTMLRIWDCFLLEGPKVLFRFALALLGVHELTLMERSDTISVIKLLKAAARLTYDTDGLVKLAFEQLKPFPKRSELCAKQMSFLKIIKERLKQKEQLREALTLTPGLSPTKFDRLPIEMLVFGEGSVGFIASGHQKRGRLAVVDVSVSRMRQQTLEFDCRVVAMVMCREDMAFVSLLSGYLVALAINELGKCEQLWELKLVDVALQLIYHDNRLFAALANGSLAVLENAVDQSPMALELYYIPVGPAPLATATVISDQLWCAMGSKAVILNIKTLDCVEQLYVAGSATGGGVSFFEKIICFRASTHGVWLTTAHSCLVQLWDPHNFTCRLLFDISADHSNNRKAMITNNNGYHGGEHDNSDVQITALLCHENSLWVGTADGYLVMYDVIRKNRMVSSAVAITPSSSANRYAAGQRVVSPTNSPSKQLYISTKEESPERINATQLKPTCCDSGYSGTSLDSSATDHKLSEDGVGKDRSKSIDRDENLRQFFAVSRRSSGDDAKENGSRNRGNDVAACRLAMRRRQKLTRAKSVELPLSALTIRISSEISTISTGPSSAAPTAAHTMPRRKHYAGGRKISRRSLRVRSSASNAYSAEPNEAIAQQLADKLTRQASQVGEGVKKWRDPSFFQRLRSVASLSSLHSTMSDSYEYDDLFLLYKDADEIEANGGLVSSNLARRESDWNLPVGLPYPIDPVRLNANHAAAGKKSFRGRAQSDAGAVKLRRKDLEFEELDSVSQFYPSANSSVAGDPPPMEHRLLASESASVLSIASSVIDPPFAYSLALQMKLKIADMPVKCLAVSKYDGQDIVVSCAGNYGDEESVLRWKKEEKTGLWINDPIVDLAASRERRSSRKFSFASVSLTSLQNGSAKRQSQ